MTRRIGIFLAAFAVLALLAVGAGAATTARADGVATVSPVSGSVNDTFTFTVTGLTPGNTVRIQITDAGGTTYQIHDSSGSPLVLVVQDDGSVTDNLTPAVDTPDAAPGDWTASFEEVETGANATIGFSVSS